jgi:hypothetical protein
VATNAREMRALTVALPPTPHTLYEHRLTSCRVELHSRITAEGSVVLDPATTAALANAGWGAAVVAAAAADLVTRGSARLIRDTWPTLEAT